MSAIDMLIVSDKKMEMLGHPTGANQVGCGLLYQDAKMLGHLEVWVPEDVCSERRGADGGHSAANQGMSSKAAWSP